MSGDLISRQAVLDVIEELKKIHFDRVVVLNKVRDRVLDLPPVNPQEPKTGHWIDHQMDRWIYAKCSECETVHDVKSNYCPNCGAKMAESEDKE